MVNSHASSVRSRKEEQHECIDYVAQITNKLDISEVSRGLGLAINDEGWAACPQNHQGGLTLRIDRSTSSFRCHSPECNDHGDIIALTQRLLNVKFEDAAKILSNGSGFDEWIDEHAADASAYGRVRDCMTAAARFYASQISSSAPYLESRGISLETAQRFMIGSGNGNDSLKRTLISQGFDEDAIQMTGLTNRHGHDRFQNHVVVPIFDRGQVVDFYGRLLDDNAEDLGKHWRLPSDRMILGNSVFNWVSSREQIILVEGVFDALSLIQQGFDNAVAMCGTNGIPDDLLHNSAIKKIFMCFDGDRAGLAQSLRRAYEFKDAGYEVRIVGLPERQDPNEFFTEHSKEEFKELLRTAPHPEVWEIDHIDANLDEHEKIEAMESVMSRIAVMEPMHRAFLCKRISKKVGLKEKDVRDHMEQLLRSATLHTGSVIDTASHELAHPALHFGNNGTLMTIPLMGENPKTRKREWQPWAVTSGREFFPLTHEELNSRGYYCHDIICPGRQRYRQETITDFLEGTKQGDLAGTLGFIKRIYQGYLDFSDPRTYDYLTAWTIGTYFFPLFNYYPYLHFTGTKEVGKSKAMKLMSQLCFNGIMSVSITDASQFRIVTELLPTLFLDETENLSDKTYSERRALLLGGYEKGSTAIRTEKIGDTFRAREYDNYSPRVFGSIDGLEDTLASRTIQIPMRRSYNEKIKEAEVELTNALFQQVRDELFLVVMDYGTNIRTTYEQLERPGEAEFDAREWNLFKPILAVGTAVGNDEIKASLIGFANAAYRSKTEGLNNTAAENVVLRYLSEFVQKPDWYEFDQIHQGIIRFVREQGLNIGELNKNRLGKLMHDLDVVDQKDRKVFQGNKIMLHFIRPEKVHQIAQNYRVK
jgi:DNA primase catalytic core